MLNADPQYAMEMEGTVAANLLDTEALDTFLRGVTTGGGPALAAHHAGQQVARIPYQYVDREPATAGEVLAQGFAACGEAAAIVVAAVIRGVRAGWWAAPRELYVCIETSVSQLSYSHVTVMVDGREVDPYRSFTLASFGCAGKVDFSAWLAPRVAL